MEDHVKQLLTEAANLIRQAARQLDTARDRCPTCGQLRAKNFKEFGAHRKLAEMPNKLMAVVDEIGREGDVR